ncbi:MAG: helix-turn-helix domain-containing protein [Leptospirales bacterium]
MKTFYRTGFAVLPVVAVSDEGRRGPAPAGATAPSDSTAAASGSELELLGFALRSELDQFMADLDRARGDFDEIPPEILIRERVPARALRALENRAEIPVIDLRGEQLANWSEARFLKALAAFRESRNVPAPDADEEGAGARGAGPAAGAPDVRGRAAPMTFTASEASGASGANRWLGEILLSAIPYALLATDLQGNTLFYNSRFEETILTRRVLKNSIRLAETFFLELTRSLLARSFEEDPLRKQRNALSTYHEELEARVRVQNLEQDGRIQGYLYIFQEPGAGELFHELVDRINRGRGLEDVIDDVEGRFIYLMLERHGQNVSHTARALKIKRSTLQNKIKRLRIDERYNRKIEGPVRRHRRTVAEILAARGKSPAAEDAPAAKSATGAAVRAKKSRLKDEKTSGKKKAAGKDAKKPVKKPVRKTAPKKKPAPAKSLKKTPKKTPKKTAKKTAKKTQKKTAKKAAKKTSKKTSKKS